MLIKKSKRYLFKNKVSNQPKIVKKATQNSNRSDEPKSNRDFLHVEMGESNL